MNLDSPEGMEELVPRPYQSQLEDIAVHKNTIIHLPTGSGKTFIAIRLINRLRKDLLKPWGEGGKRTFFLVNTVPLVLQQKKVIESLCAVKSVIGYSGEDNVDYWDKDKWDVELAKHQVIVMTSQILADMLTHSYIRIIDINLLIFDECHHAVDDHPMRLVMKHFDGVAPENQPRVLGLTATLLNCNVTVHKVEQTLRQLETTFHATIAAINEMGEVLNYSTNPNEIIKYYKDTELPPAADEAIKILQDLIDLILVVKLPRITGEPTIKLEEWQRDIGIDPNKIVKEVKNMVLSMITLIQEFGVYGGALGILAYIILLERLKRKAISAPEEKLYNFTITHSGMARMILINHMENDEGYDKIIKHSSPKVLQFLNILKEYNPDLANTPGVLSKVNFSKKALSCIIFTKQRFTAKILYNLLREIKEVNPKEFGFLQHDFIVGFNINPYKSTREQFYIKKASQTALLKFSNKELNCLIATNVIEEGVDIPQCMLVLRYDSPVEYRSYIQSKGRARSSESTYVIMVNENDKSKFSKLYHSFQITENYIQRILVGKSEDRNAPNQSDIEDSLYKEDVIPAYVTESGCRLSSVQAISLLNKYCSMLPQSQFSVIAPVWIEEKVLDRFGDLQYQVKIYMPIGCPVRDVIIGDPMTQGKAAKRSAALKACIKLHQVGELEPDTLLPRRYGQVDFEKPDVRCCFPNWPWDEPEDENTSKPGTKKSVRQHKRVFPTFLEGSNSWSSGMQKFYLHIIKLNTAFEEPKDPREKALYNLLQRDQGYGFLTSNPLPQLCDFPMFLTVGEVTTSMRMNYAVIQLDTNLFELVKSFHFFVFDQVLEVAKKFTVFEGKVNCLYVVPIKNSEGYDIDWEAMQIYTYIRPVGEPTFEERTSIQVSPEEYQYHVVTPWYRGTILPARYIVSNVLEYMSPQSQFESGTELFGTYADYYSAKYNLEILGKKDQPLLEVRNISSRLNCLLPRAASIKAYLSDKQMKQISLAQGDDKPKGFPEIFIPEFCIKYDFPGVLWFKAVLLPSIIHRVSMLLVAYELRSEISEYTKMGKSHLAPGKRWAPIEVHLQVAAHSLLSLIEDPTPILTIDRINNPIDEDAPRPMNIVSMKQSLYKLQKKKINEQYNWDEKAEPIDIERNISTVTVMDIECYDEFVSVSMIGSPSHKLAASPPRPTTTTTAAILPPPVKRVCPITILSKKPSALGPELRDILAAITTIKSHDTCNLERVETFGDSFLKFAACLYLFHKFPMLNEGQLTSIKGRLVGNRNLYYAGVKLQIPGRMKVEQFSPRKDFLVPGFFAPQELQTFIEKEKVRPTCLIGLQFPLSDCLSGVLSEESLAVIHQRCSVDDGIIEKEPAGGAQGAMQCYVRAQAVSDKSVADCVEALIGTYLLTDGIKSAVKVLEWFKIIPPKDNLTELLSKSIPTVLSQRLVTEEEINRIINYSRDDVEEILNYKFKDPSLLLEALSHPSYIRNRYTHSYERLEFLGDAILDFLITSHIFETSADLKPGELTDLRSALVNNVTFASYVVKLGLHKFMCYQLNPVLESAIMTFIQHQEQRGNQVLEDVLYLIYEEDCHIAEYVEVPKILSDVFESLAGAIYLDSGGDLGKVWSVYYSIMCEEIFTFSRRIPQQPVKILNEMIHACPTFGDAEVCTKNSLKVMVPVTVTKNGLQYTVHGFGRNTFQAKRAAAKVALKVLSC